MYFDLFPNRVYKYHLDPTRLKHYMLERYNSYKDHSTNGVPSGWNCNVRTEFQGAFPQEIREDYARVLAEWREEIGLYDTPQIDEIWLNAYEESHFQEPHSHLPGFFSGIHYVMFDPEVHKGTTFQNPQDQLFSFMFDDSFLDPEKNTHLSENGDIDVEEGDILIFPSHLKHFVERNDSKQLRMTISFNINRIAESTRRVFA